MITHRHYVQELWWPDAQPHPSDWEELLAEHDVDVVPPYQLAGDGIYALAPLPREME